MKAEERNCVGLLVPARHDPHTLKRHTLKSCYISSEPYLLTNEHCIYSSFHLVIKSTAILAIFELCPPLTVCQLPAVSTAQPT